MKPDLLKGVKIIDFTTYAAAPATGRMLGDWGADVIKVEGLEGDPARIFGLSMGLPAQDEENAIWEFENANKRGIALDLKHPKGMEAMLKLLETADAIISNVRIGPLQKMGLDYETLSGRFPHLVWGHISGYGLYGEEAPRPGFDVVAFWARGGSLIDLPSAGSELGGIPFAIGDHTASLALASGVLGGIVKAKMTGKGEKIVVSLFGTATWVNGLPIISTQYGDTYPKSRYLPTSPLSNTYKCKDGEWITLTVLQYDKQWGAICSIFGMEDLADDPKYNTIIVAREPENTEYICRRIEKEFLRENRTFWAEKLNAADIPFECVCHYKDIAQDKQAIANNYVVPFTCKSGKTVMMPSSPVQFSVNEPIDLSYAPTLGQHGSEILRELGYSDAEIESLQQMKATN